jgi:hypothetical protein
MDNLVDYIKKNYPKVIFTPFKFKQSRALAFIISDNKLVIGYINAGGSLCKLINPIDLEKLTNESVFYNIINAIPTVSGFNEADKSKLLTLFQSKSETVEKPEQRKIENDLKRRISELESDNQKAKDEYRALYDSNSNQILLVKNEYEEKIAKITEQYNTAQQELETCKRQIVDQKDAILQGINQYKQEIQNFIESKDLRIQDLENIHERDKTERAELQARLNELLENEKRNLEELRKSKGDEETIQSKVQEIESLTSAIRDIQSELNNTKEDLKRSQLQEKLLRGFRERCKDKILDEKQQIIDKIKEYNERWNEWLEKSTVDVNEYKRRLLTDLQSGQESLKSVLQQQSEKSNIDDMEIKRLKQNIIDIETALKQTTNDQLIKLAEREEELKRVTAERDELQSRQSDLEQSTIELQTELDSLREANKSIPDLQKELEQVRALLAQNDRTKIESVVDYDNCESILSNFVALNNIFYRKQEIIKRLDDIITNNLDVFSKLSEVLKNNIRINFETVKTEITNHIKFLNLSEYINSPNFQYLKNKVNRDQVPAEFCKDLGNLLEYWNVNKSNYRRQDRILTNIYEDLSGAVRVYIRIKPLLGGEQQLPTVTLKTVENKRTKSLIVDCSESPDTKFKEPLTFGEFYGIFDETYTNLDLYTGQIGYPSSGLKVDVNNLVDSSDSVSPGLYSVFNQIQDGYSIVLFGYGLSGSGKTLTLLGSKGAPGILHYGLTNLQNVSKIKLKYLFEQYYYKVNFNYREVTGHIHNLINRVPQMAAFSKDENEEFKQVIPGYIDVNAMRVEDLSAFTDIVDSYRQKHGRIKQTPNNPQSSRSHLYYVFEITFTDGKSGYITIVDMAGRESPLDIFNTFIDTTKTTLPSIMAPPPVGGEANIANSMKQELVETYTPKQINQIINESFYINETINHLIYYFNLKNDKRIETPKQKVDERFNVVYKITSYFVKPEDEMTNISSSNNALTIPILNFLNNLNVKQKESDDWKPTKFVTICCIRQEQKYCDQTTETVKFAQNIRST